MHLSSRKILLIADGIDEWGDEPLQADRIIRKVKAETEAGNLLAIFSSREYGIARYQFSLQYKRHIYNRTHCLRYSRMSL